MRSCRFRSFVLLAGLRGLCLALLAVTCGGVGAQDAEAPTQPRWMPRPSRYLDRPMTEAEYEACIQRTDIPKLGPHPHPPSDMPPAPRRLLEEPVAAEVNGNVADAVTALMAQTKREWLVSIRGDSADKVAQFSANGLPLWQALDMLLETYGYDWGFAHGAVVCWPALIPARARPETPEPAQEAEVAPAAGAPPVEIAEPTPVDSALDHFRPARGPGGIGTTVSKLNRRVAVDARLRDWNLVGRMADADPVRGIQQVAAVLTAVIQGTPQEGAICMGAHMWLDRAMRGADALAADLKAQGVDVADPMRGLVPLHDRLCGLVTAQQWALMDIRGQAVIRFRELPLDVAELWVVTARAGEAKWAKIAVEGKDFTMDWTRPENFYATAYYADEIQKSAEDGLYRVVGRYPGVGTGVPMKSGGWRGL